MEQLQPEVQILFAGGEFDRLRWSTGAHSGVGRGGISRHRRGQVESANWEIAKLKRTALIREQPHGSHAVCEGQRDDGAIDWVMSDAVDDDAGDSSGAGRHRLRVRPDDADAR